MSDFVTIESRLCDIEFRWVVRSGEFVSHPELQYRKQCPTNTGKGWWTDWETAPTIKEVDDKRYEPINRALAESYRHTIIPR